METHNQQGAGTRGAGRKFAPAGTLRGNGTEAARERARERMESAFRGATLSEKEAKKRSKGRSGNDEDEFTLGGKRYVARTFNPCKGCVFSSFPGTCSQYARPECDSERRKDGRDVVFVLKEEEGAR